MVHLKRYLETPRPQRVLYGFHLRSRQIDNSRVSTLDQQVGFLEQGIAPEQRVTGCQFAGHFGARIRHPQKRTFGFLFEQLRQCDCRLRSGSPVPN